MWQKAIGRHALPRWRNENRPAPSGRGTTSIPTLPGRRQVCQSLTTVPAARPPRACWFPDMPTESQDPVARPELVAPTMAARADRPGTSKELTNEPWNTNARERERRARTRSLLGAQSQTEYEVRNRLRLGRPAQLLRGGGNHAASGPSEAGKTGANDKNPYA